MQYYQKAAQKIREGEQLPLHAAAAYGAGGLAAAGSKSLGKLVSSVGALVNPHVPDNISMAGLNNVDPRFGKFIKGAVDQGYNYDEVRGFIEDKFKPSQRPTESPKQQQTEKPKEGRNIIEQYSPELHQFIAQQVASGRKPIEAGALAQNDKRFADVINKLSKEHNTPWSSIIDSVYGTGEQPGALNNPQQAPQKQGGSDWNSIKQDIENAMKS